MTDLQEMLLRIDEFVKHLFDADSPLLQDYYGVSGPCPAMSLAGTLKVTMLYHHKAFPFNHFKGFYNNEAIACPTLLGPIRVLVVDDLLSEKLVN